MLQDHTFVFADGMCGCVKVIFLRLHKSILVRVYWRSVCLG